MPRPGSALLSLLWRVWLPSHLLVACAPGAAPNGVVGPTDPARGDTASAADTAADPAGDTGHPVDSGEDSAPPAQPAAVAILRPTDGEDLTNPVTFEVQLTRVHSARLDADGYAIADFSDEGNHTFTYTFTGTGYPRQITLTGYDSAGAALTSDQITIEVAPDERSLDVPYFYQYDNRYEPGSTCGITSAAMLITYWNPGSVTPDTLYTTYGKTLGQSPDGLASIYTAEGLAADHGTRATRDELRALLDAGMPVVVHGYWTGAGHIAVLVGYSDTDWIVNDPAGDWYTCYGCGPADHIRYPFGGDWDDAMSVDGDIWWSTASP